MLRAHGRSEQRRDERRRRYEWRDAWSCVRLWRCAVTCVPVNVVRRSQCLSQWIALPHVSVKWVF